MNYASKLAIIFTEKCFYFLRRKTLFRQILNSGFAACVGRYFSASLRKARLSWRMRSSWVSTEAQSMGRTMMSA